VTANRLFRGAAFAALALLALASCRQDSAGPLRVVAIGGPPVLVNPSRQPVSAASALLLQTVAQGLVHFNAAGEIEPALAQSWIVSDDGRRFTFRLRRTLWAGGEPVTARQVVERLQAAIARNSRNTLRPVLGSIEQIEAMTEQVLEIRLRAPRPNLLQLLAQPELAILSGNQGTGPYRVGGEVDGAIRLVPPPPDEDAVSSEAPAAEIMLRSASAPEAVARFAAGRADLVTGGTIGDYLYATAAGVEDEQIVLDPARGLFGLAIASRAELLQNAEFRGALSMAIDRQGMLARFNVPGVQPRMGMLPQGLSEVPQPALPEWAGEPLATRRERAAQIVTGLAEDDQPRLRVAMPAEPGYRIVFAHLRRDWRAIGVDAVAVPAGAEADLRLVDQVAPADLAPWFLRQFLCSVSPVCDQGADLFIEGARLSPTPEQRRTLLAAADRTLTGITAFIPLGPPPVRWSLRTARLNGFRPNAFARHVPTELIEASQ
jgi:oligopeptide transport system substrate-binding protein